MFSLRLDRIHVILVNPAIAGNIGAVARLLKNFDISSIILVNPSVSPLNPNALAQAREAKDIVYQASIFKDLKTALAPFNYAIATTTRRRYKRNKVFLKEILPFLISLSQKNEIALVFGPERTGLTNKDLDLCHSIITIPTSNLYPSLNLAQAVAIILYELYSCSLIDNVLEELACLATVDQLEEMYEHLISSLAKIDFVLGGEKKRTYRILKRLFGKIFLTPNDIRIIRGICHQIDLFTSGKRFT